MNKMLDKVPKKVIGIQKLQETQAKLIGIQMTSNHSKNVGTAQTNIKTLRIDTISFQTHIERKSNLYY